MSVRAIFALVLSLAACGTTSDPPDSEPATPPVEQRYGQAVSRLMSLHVSDRGYVFTRRAGDGAPKHLGEGGLWSCVAMAHLPCDRAAELVRHWVRNTTERAGRYRRWEPLPDEYEQRPWNFDGETGCQYGLAVYASRCEMADTDLYELGEAWRLHREATKDDLGSGEAMPEAFGFTQRALDHELGLTEHRAPEWRLRAMEVAAASWAWALHPQQAACYRAHLAYRHLRAAERMGYGVLWAGFCAATNGLGLPNVDWRCERPGLREFLDGYVENAWENRMQRCAPPWESEDGNGDDTPGLDLIEALDEAHGLGGPGELRNNAIIGTAQH